MSTATSGKRKVVIAIVGILVLGAGVWGAVTYAKGRKPSLPKEYSTKALEAAAENPVQLFDRMHEARTRTDLTEEQRHALWENVHNVMEARMEKQLDEYFTADAGQRQAVLDRHLDQMQPIFKEMEQRRAQWERERQNAQSRSQPGGPNAGAGAPPGGAGVAAGGPPPGGPNAGPRDGRRGPPTREQRKMRSESRNPDQRARRMAYFTDLRKRAQERGIQMPGFMGRRP